MLMLKEKCRRLLSQEESQGEANNEGVAYAFPDAKGFGGNTTTAALARKVFGSSNMRSRLVQLVPHLYRPAMEKILLNDLILLRLMSCDYKLLPAKIGIEVNEP